MKKNYNDIFKIEPSKNDSSHYNVYRKSDCNQFKLVATLVVSPGIKYELNSIHSISKDELDYLIPKFRELAKIVF